MLFSDDIYWWCVSCAWDKSEIEMMCWFVFKETSESGDDDEEEEDAAEHEQIHYIIQWV